MNSDFAEYQAGFRSCLAGVDQYLLMTDIGRRNRSDMLTQLSSRLPRTDAHHENSRTLDSAAHSRKSPNLGPQRLAANAVEQANPAAETSCLTVSGKAHRIPEQPAKTPSSNATGKDSCPSAPQVVAFATKRLNQDRSTVYSTKASFSIEGQCNDMHLMSPCDPYWRPW